ncbi:MAG: aggregation factor core [Litoreibacter sp.]|nr:aggregation factor core [Litoreibacter sp.]MCY4335585.1 aggregation factor core [Litoreibacter sp.]
MKYLIVTACLVASPALADISVEFREGAPKDRFTFTNTGTCAIGPATLELDLGDSAAGLIFDTTGAGAGVEVFQPYETVAGAASLASVSQVRDGDNRLELSLSKLAPGGSIAFTIDVDDTLRDSALGQIRVSDSEIAGATVALISAQGTASGVFDATSAAFIRVNSCTS